MFFQSLGELIYVTNIRFWIPLLFQLQDTKFAPSVRADRLDFLNMVHFSDDQPNDIASYRPYVDQLVLQMKILA